jgi:hypothetical protein
LTIFEEQYNLTNDISATTGSGSAGQKTVQPTRKFLESKQLQGHNENHARSVHCAQQFTQMEEYCCAEEIPTFRMSSASAE